MRDGTNRRRAGGSAAGAPAQLAAFAAALLASLSAGAALSAASDAAVPAPSPAVHVPWSVRHELNRAEALLRREDARLRVGDEVQVLRQGEEVVLRVPARLLFTPDSENLRPGLKTAQMLSVPTLLLRQRRHLMTRIEVYTDNIGGVQLNEQLSARRAAVLASALLTAGISVHRVQAYGRGAAQAVAGNDSAEGRTLNRRVEFVFARLGSQAAREPAPDAAPPGNGAPVGSGAPASTALRPAPAAASAGG